MKGGYKMKNFKLGKLPNKNNIYKIKKIAITSGIILTLTTGCGINKNKDWYYEKEWKGNKKSPVFFYCFFVGMCSDNVDVPCLRDGIRN